MNTDKMKQRLMQFFPESHPITDIDVIDLTGTSDHWEVSVRNPGFVGLTRIEQHQKVMEAFAAELKSGEVHALSIKTSPTR